MLVATFLIMGVATFLVGVLPGYDAIGVLAPVLIVTLRIFQGIGLGGEWGGAVLMAVEPSSDDQRGLNGSWPQMGMPAGLVLGTGAVGAASGDAGLARALPARRHPHRGRALHLREPGVLTRAGVRHRGPHADS